MDSHYGTQNNYLFSITHDLKVRVVLFSVKFWLQSDDLSCMI